MTLAQKLPMPKAPSPSEKSLALLSTIVNFLDEKKASDIRVIEVGDSSAITDFFVIATGSADKQVVKMGVELEKMIRADGVHIVGSESDEESGWSVVDAFDVIVHLLRAEQRANYKLEALWKNGKEIPLKRFLSSAPRALPDQAVLLAGNSVEDSGTKVRKSIRQPKASSSKKIIVPKSVVRKTAAAKSLPDYAEQAAKTNSMKKKSPAKTAAEEVKKTSKTHPEKQKAVRKIIAKKKAGEAKAIRTIAKAKSASKTGVISGKKRA